MAETGHYHIVASDLQLVAGGNQTAGAPAVSRAAPSDQGRSTGLAIAPIQNIDPAHVLPRFAVGRHTAVTPYCVFTCIVGRHRAVKVAVELFKQPGKIGNTGSNIVKRIKRVDHAKTGLGGRHQLHQPLGAAVRYSLGLKPGLGMHDGANQSRINAENFAGGLYFTAVRSGIERRALPVDPLAAGAIAANPLDLIAAAGRLAVGINRYAVFVHVGVNLRAGLQGHPAKQRDQKAELESLHLLSLGNPVKLFSPKPAQPLALSSKYPTAAPFSSRGSFPGGQSVGYRDTAQLPPLARYPW